jgi:hypothetical protein
LILVVLLASDSLASSKQGGQTPTFRTRVDAVTVDVNATDADGRPVTDRFRFAD